MNSMRMLIAVAIPLAIGVGSARAPVGAVSVRDRNTMLGI